MGDPAKRNVILDWLFGAPAPGADRGTPPAPRRSAAREETGGFQPFGYRFEVRSFLPPAQAKAALRSRMKDWFDAAPGARGWILGPFLCLWSSAFNRSGPMLLAIVRRGDFGTTVAGRAGSDLNGLAAFCVLMPLLAFVLYQMVSAGDYTTRDVVIIGGLLLLSPLILWLYHRERRTAEPLVRFIEDAVARAEGRGPAVSTDFAALRTLTLTTAGGVRVGPTAEEIHDALLAVGEDEFAILAAGEETYIQSAFGDGGFVLERRDGGDAAHFRAVRADDPSEVIFTFDEVVEAFTAWAEEAPAPDWMAWEPMRLAA